MSKITPFLWFNDQAEQAAKFYVSVFKGNSKVVEIMRDGKKCTSAVFKLDGRTYFAFNGGPHFKFTPAISLFVDCKDQKEVDRLWNALSKGGKPSNCGWLQDKFGLSWQIIPKAMTRMLYADDEDKSSRAWEAMIKMGKIDVAAMKRAYDGKKLAP